VNNIDNKYQGVFKVAKRIAITILCCIPVMILFGYFTRNIIKTNGLQIVCFMVIMGIAVAVVEVIARAKEKAKKEEIETKKDVFK
ncbi:MAG: hypothetical protein IKY10_01415, partial [Clostridia bacterium]|nr:hypothetical protein [Clostridia bacterium]